MGAILTPNIEALDFVQCTHVHIGTSSSKISDLYSSLTLAFLETTCFITMYVSKATPSSLLIW